MFKSAELELELIRLRETVGEMYYNRLVPGPILNRLYKLEERLYAIEEWQQRVEKKIGVETVTRRDGKKQFMNTLHEESEGWLADVKTRPHKQS